jgi:hypothetical protein
MMNNEEINQRIMQLEIKIARLTEHRFNQQRTYFQRDNFSFKLAKTGLALIISILFLIAMAIVMRYRLETLRLETHPPSPIFINPETQKDKKTSKEPMQQGSPSPITEQAPDIKRALDDYVDNLSNKSSNGNSYSLTLSGLDQLIKSLIGAGTFTAEKATNLIQELGKNAITTTGDILKETAKAIIAKHLGPTPEPKEIGNAPTQQVQVNVYSNEKQPIINKHPKVVPPKPKKTCPTAVIDTKPISCQTDTLSHHN